MNVELYALLAYGAAAVISFGVAAVIVLIKRIFAAPAGEGESHD